MNGYLPAVKINSANVVERYESDLLSDQCRNRQSLSEAGLTWPVN